MTNIFMHDSESSEICAEDIDADDKFPQRRYQNSEEGWRPTPQATARARPSLQIVHRTHYRGRRRDASELCSRVIVSTRSYVNGTCHALLLSCALRIFVRMARRSKTTGEVLSDARRARELTQAAVAERLERSQSWVSRLESDEVVPPTRTLRRIAEVYGVPLTALIPA